MKGTLIHNAILNKGEQRSVRSWDTFVIRILNALDNELKNVIFVCGTAHRECCSARPLGIQYNMHRIMSRLQKTSIPSTRQTNVQM